MSDGRVSLGTFFVFSGLGLLLVLRGQPNDAYAGILVFMIALLQLFEYGVWNDLGCNPGQSNTKASKGAYLLLWLMPAVLCISGAYLGSNLVADPSSRNLLLGAGFMFFALFLSLASIWQPIWYFQNEKVPMRINMMWLLGMVLPTILVDPAFLGAGTLALAGGAYFAGRYADPLAIGEWLSVTSLLANSIAVWALAVPRVREALYGPGVAY
jgi:hypothetical protein